MKKIKGLSPNHVCSSQDGHILCIVDFGWTNSRVFSKNHVFVQKSRWPYSVQNKFGMDKIQGSHKLEWLYVLFPVRIYFISSTKVTDYL